MQEAVVISDDSAMESETAKELAESIEDHVAQTGCRDGKITNTIGGYGDREGKEEDIPF